MTIMALVILLCGFLVKFAVFGRPFLGYFGSYQAMVAMMAEMMLKAPPQSFFIPRTYILLNGQPEIHLLYYPFSAWAAALFKTVFGGSMDFWGRFQAGLFMLGAGIFFFKAAKKVFGEKIALIALLIFTFSPMALLDGTSLRNEASALFFLTASFWFLAQGESFLLSFIAGLSFSCAIVARLHFIFVMPAFCIFIVSNREAAFRRAVIFLTGVFLPLAAWILWARHINALYQDNVMTSLFSQAGEGRVLSSSLFFQYAFYLRLLKILAIQLLTPAVFPFLIAGVFVFPGPHRWFLSAWAAGAAAAIILLPQKVNDHPFYLISLLPAAAIFSAAAIEIYAERLPVAIQKGGAILLIVMSLVYTSRPAFSDDHSSMIPEIGKVVQSLTAEKDAIVAQHGTAPDLLYYSQRMGWPFDVEMAHHPLEDQLRFRKMKEEGYGNPQVWLEKLRGDGAKYLVISEPEKFLQEKDFFEYVQDHYQKIPVDSDKFYIFDLRQLHQS